MKPGSYEGLWRRFQLWQISRRKPKKSTFAAQAVWDEAKFDGREFSADAFVEHCKTLDLSGKYDIVVAHHSVTGEYTSISLAQVARNWWAYYRQTKGWSGAPHGIIATRGVAILNALEYDGIHVSGHNSRSRGAEMLGNFTSVMPNATLYSNAVKWFAGVLYAGRLEIGALHYHREYNSTACPGATFIKNWAKFKTDVEVKLQQIKESVTPSAPWLDADWIVAMVPTIVPERDHNVVLFALDHKLGAAIPNAYVEHGNEEAWAFSNGIVVRNAEGEYRIIDW